MSYIVGTKNKIYTLNHESLDEARRLAVFDSLHNPQKVFHVWTQKGGWNSEKRGTWLARYKAGKQVF